MPSKPVATRPEKNQSPSAEPASADRAAAVLADETAASKPYVAAWNQLVSTTNWDKGRIICQWRGALVDEGAAASEYSDEAWANLVGGVSGQHVGRLRRVFERFGEVYEEYPGIYWSHFQVAMEWDDAEMWLEGSVQNSWSVSQMRAKRWETVGGPDEREPRNDDPLVTEIDEDAVDADISPAASPKLAEVKQAGGDHSATSETADREPGASTKRTKADSESTGPAVTPPRERRRPFANLPDLPDDVAEAFEQFKLAILTHKLAGWNEISRDDMVACLDALRELALLPADD